MVGCPALSLWLSIDTPDIDLECDLYEIQPDGTSIALWSDLRRLRYRESLREAKLVKPGEIVRCDFNPGLFVARRLMKGSRLRLVVTAVNSILWQKNYCSGGIVAEETAKDAHPGGGYQSGRAPARQRERGQVGHVGTGSQFKQQHCQQKCKKIHASVRRKPVIQARQSRPLLCSIMIAQSSHRKSPRPALHPQRLYSPPAFCGRHRLSRFSSTCTIQVSASDSAANTISPENTTST